jgi:hypothetical protein
MSLKFSQGIYKLKNPDKYVGNNTPKYRSGWEMSVMLFCDNNPAVEKWASESIKIPYRDPLTGKQTVYVPDFFVMYTDKTGRKHSEIWEIKPQKHTVLEKVGKNPYDQAQYVKNQAKWQVAQAWCKQHGVFFRIINEDDLFFNGKKRTKK